VYKSSYNTRRKVVAWVVVFVAGIIAVFVVGLVTLKQEDRQGMLEDIEEGIEEEAQE